VTARRAACRVLLAVLPALVIPLHAHARAAPVQTDARDALAQPDPAPVVVGGTPVVWVPTGAGPYTPQFRADRISRRLYDAIHDRTLPDPTITVVESEGSSELRAGSRLLMVITPQDARALGAPRAAVAQQYARELEAAIREERQRYAPSALVRAAVRAAIATLILVAVLWLIRRLTRWLRHAINQFRRRRPQAIRVQKVELVSAKRLTQLIDRTLVALRVVLILIALDVYLTYVLGLFPWTRAVASRLLGYVLTPLGMIAAAFIGYLPKLLFVIVIAAVIYAAIRLVGVFFRQIQDGRMVFASFPAEWADPTNKIARVLLIAFGVVIAFPYLPASESPAFAGVSVFMGVLISLASSSALSNMMAGIVLTYTGAFRVGDRVKVGDSFGDIVETTLLATRVRTIKNEEITIPNSVVLGTSTLNYSRSATTLGLILHTSVTIGYDAPWRKVRDLLIEAALATPGVLREPAPFVWQTALNDFYVTYEINAYTNTPRDMIDIYAALHANIQDAFYAAGVEIMSPHYAAIRDGNTVAIPESSRPPGYQAPAFRVGDSPASGSTPVRYP
jgi:small-conductance mechanosensitive channel